MPATAVTCRAELCQPRPQTTSARQETRCHGDTVTYSILPTACSAGREPPASPQFSADIVSSFALPAPPAVPARSQNTARAHFVRRISSPLSGSALSARRTSAIASNSTRRCSGIHQLPLAAGPLSAAARFKIDTEYPLWTPKRYTKQPIKSLWTNHLRSS